MRTSILLSGMIIGNNLVYTPVIITYLAIMFVLFLIADIADVMSAVRRAT